LLDSFLEALSQHDPCLAQSSLAAPSDYGMLNRAPHARAGFRNRAVTTVERFLLAKAKQQRKLPKESRCPQP
jgi:hypothetical protein